MRLRWCSSWLPAQRHLVHVPFSYSTHRRVQKGTQTGFWAEHVLQRKLCLTQPVYSSQALRLTEEEGWIPTPAALVRQPDQVRF